ncbi:hypothetical protein [Propionicimonas sp.]|uniref:hypothetical protein n=1 Tax=Propionicimonas sp. TaxID=1955623 RepID=UPI001814B415|nr:hypothetical protein [Propionicimonas sp.]MBA3019611.1 hypothetical protein [Propionicimonas sp.]MBU4208043.1 hypothetical protein [Actinomycetota bacterium]MBU4411502.1 hypothetical protein [Actinomycetota bacterium]MCG2805731.1 hypothetical protein [Propionicimonas sp.]
MSAEWFELGQRLHAATSGRLVPRLRHAPLLAGAKPVAVRATEQGGVVRVSAAAPGGQPGSGQGLDGLALLAGLGVSLDEPEPATLVTDDPGTLRTLLGLARTVAVGCAADAVAGHIAWWADRADFPGGGAVADVVAGCRARWISGQAPKAEYGAALWRDRLGVGDASVAGVLDVYAQATAGDPLRFLSDLATDDSFSYDMARKAHCDGWDWRRPDQTSRAACGLRGRCDAADLYAAALLSDPLWRARSVHAGSVVVGRIAVDAPATQRVVPVACARLDARLRAGAEVLWWLGAPGEVPDADYTGTVGAGAVVGGQLVLDVKTPFNRPTLKAGDLVTLMPAPPSVHRQHHGQMVYRKLQYSRRSWLTSGTAPAVRRRSVPLDVLLAGASDD